MAKIAFLYSGLSRQWEHCLESQRSFFLENEVHVFFHFWDPGDEQEKARIIKAFKPAAYTFTPQKDFTAMEAEVKHRDNINAPDRLIGQYYGWWAIGEIFRDYMARTKNHYDFAVRIRSDLMFFDPLDDWLKRLKPNELLISSYNNFDIANDMFAVGGIEPIMYYLSMFNHVMTYKDETIFNPELLLVHHLNKRADVFRYLQSPIVMLVFRPHMVGMPIEECLKEHPGLSKWKDAEIIASHAESHRRFKGAAGELHVERFKSQQLRLLEQAKARAAATPPKN